MLKRDEGAMAIIVALFASMMFIFGALVVSGGAGREARRDAQDAADAAALAAVAVLAESGTRRDAVAAAADYGVANNFPADKTIPDYFDGCTAAVPSGWQRSAPTSCVAFKPDGTGRWSAVQVVTPQVTLPRLFGAVTAPVRALAQASIEPGALTSPPVLFGGSSACGAAVEWADIDANGDIHSNGDLDVGNGSVVGDGTYRGSVSSPSRTSWTPAANNPVNVAVDEDVLRAYPKAYNIADFRAGGRWRASVVDAGTTNITRRWLSRNPTRANPYLDGNDLRQGIYLTRGNVDINGDVNSTGGGATFVGDSSSVRFGGSGTKTLSPFADGLLAFSTRSGSCNTDGILIRGSGQVVFRGAVYAPSSRLSISGNVSLTSPGGVLEAAVVRHTARQPMTLTALPETIVGPPTIHLSK